MLVLIPAFWIVLALGQVGTLDDCQDEALLRKASPVLSVPMTGKPIKIPPKKV